jgi:hypothetical protein
LTVQGRQYDFFCNLRYSPLRIAELIVGKRYKPSIWKCQYIFAIKQKNIAAREGTNSYSRVSRKWTLDIQYITLDSVSYYIVQKDHRRVEASAGYYTRWKTGNIFMPA